MTFSEQIVYGWFKPSKYKDMIELPRRRFVVYVIVMMLVLAIVSYVVPTASIISGFGGFEKLFTQSLGEVNYTDDTLSVSNNWIRHRRRCRTKASKNRACFLRLEARPCGSAWY